MELSEYEVSSSALERPSTPSSYLYFRCSDEGRRAGDSGHATPITHQPRHPPHQMARLANIERNRAKMAAVMINSPPVPANPHDNEPHSAPTRTTPPARTVGGPAQPAETCGGGGGGQIGGGVTQAGEGPRGQEADPADAPERPHRELARPRSLRGGRVDERPSHRWGRGRRCHPLARRSQTAEARQR